MRNRSIVIALVGLAFSTTAFAQSASVAGVVRDDTGGGLPGVTVELTTDARPQRSAVTDGQGRYLIDAVAPGGYELAFVLANFGLVRRPIHVSRSGRVVADVVLHLAVNADVTVSGRRTFTNLADVENPAEDLLGIAQSASQGAVTAAQLDRRPLMREADVLEAIPGVIVTQHSGEGKANQYFLRGFNLDHGTDFATTVAGMPVNLPTHAHGQGYSDLNFVLPELVSGVTFSKGPYFAEQGDFATAGASAITYTSALDHPIAKVEIGGQGFSRAVVAASPRLASGHLLAAIEAGHDNGPWTRPDDFRKLNTLVRYSQGDAVNGFSLTAMGYRALWNSSDQVPQRAIASGALGRLDTIDPSDGGQTYRYSFSADWQRANRSGNASTHVTAYGVGSSLDLFSNFTYFLNDPVRGDQIEQADRRFTSGVSATHRRISRWFGRLTQNTVGLEIRNDDIANVALYHTRARVRLDTVDEAAVRETASGAFVQNDIEWLPWLRTTAGLRTDAVRSRVDARDANNSGTSTAGLVSPKAGVAIGPWKRAELYVNTGTGFHSNDARGTTITHDPDGNPVNRVTPLVRARGAEVGVRTAAVPHFQTTVAWWSLSVDSELVFSGDEGTTASSRPSARHGVEITNYYSPAKWLAVDADASWSRSRYTTTDPAGQYVPEAVGAVFSAGATVTGPLRAFGGVRWRYFGPRPLVEDNSIRSKPTKTVNAQAGYQLARGLRVSLDVFNLFDVAASDVDYFYVSRLPGEPLGGVADVHTHPVLPRTIRANLTLGF